MRRRRWWHDALRGDMVSISAHQGRPAHLPVLDLHQLILAELAPISRAENTGEAGQAASHDQDRRPRTHVGAAALSWG